MSVQPVEPPLPAPAARGRAAGALERLRAHGALAAAGAAVLIGAPYLLHLASPLRLAGDEIAYLSIAARMAGDFPAVDLKIDYPPGYPALLAGLERVGLGVPWAFVGSNLVFLAVATAAAYLLLRRDFGLGRPAALLACALLPLSRIVVWTAATPRSDVAFLALALLCLLLLVRARARPPVQAWPALGAAALLAAGAVQVRTIGVALLPPLLFACLRRPELVRRLRAARPRLPAAALALLALAGLAAAATVAVRGTGYVEATRAGWGTEDGVGVVAVEAARQLRAELGDVGELAVNVRRGRAGALADAYPLVGALVVAGVLAGAWTRRRRLTATDVFVASTGAVLFLWPGNDSRLWLPALPLLAGYLALAARRHARRPAVPAAALAYAAAFAVTGAATLARSTAVGLSGAEFPAAWAKTAPALEATYELAFGQRTRAEPGDIDRRVLLLLRRYEPRARP